LPEFGLLIFISCVWGFSFFFIKKGLDSFTPMQVGALRIFLSFVIMLPAWLFVKEKIPRSMILPALWMALLGSGIPPFLFAIAESRISSAIAGVLNSLTPLFVLLTGAAFFGVASGRQQILGVSIGLLGAIAITIFRADGSFELNFGYAFLVVLATLCYGMNANILRKYGHRLSSLTLTTLVFTLIGPPAGFYLLMTDTFTRLTTSPKGWESFGYLLLLSWVGTALALILFTILLKRTSALFATMTTYLIPVVAVLVGLADGERIGVIHVTGLMLILAGVYVTSSAREVIRKD
jgi:drug/metabolite transporter (DMT)-like permease